MSVPPGWSPTCGLGGLPLWRWSGGSLCVATGDMDQLRFIGVALGRFDRMTADEPHTYPRG